MSFETCQLVWQLVDGEAAAFEAKGSILATCSDLDFTSNGLCVTLHCPFHKLSSCMQVIQPKPKAPISAAVGPPSKKFAVPPPARLATESAWAAPEPPVADDSQGAPFYKVLSALMAIIQHNLNCR